MGDPLFVHVHIPRSGGTSINSALNWWFKERYVLWHHDDPATVWSVAEMEQKIKENPEMVCLSSHYIRRFPKEIGGRRILYFSFVRDPLAWFVSNFTYIQKNFNNLSKSHVNSLPANAARLSLRDFVRVVLEIDESKPLSGHWLNRFFSEQILRDKQAEECVNENFQTRCLDISKSVLNKFSFIGVNSRFEECFQALRTWMCGYGLDLCSLAAPRENVSSEGKVNLEWVNPADEVGKIVLEKLRMDFELYDFARQIADEHIKRYSAENPVRLGKFSSERVLTLNSNCIG